MKKLEDLLTLVIIKFLKKFKDFFVWDYGKCLGFLGTYEGIILSFSLKNASDTYQITMNLIFHYLIRKFMQVYIDDVVVKFESKRDYLNHLKQSFERRKHTLKINSIKCAFSVLARHKIEIIKLKLFWQHSQRIRNNFNPCWVTLYYKNLTLDKDLTKKTKDFQKSKCLLYVHYQQQCKYSSKIYLQLLGKTQVFSLLLQLKNEVKFKWEEENQEALREIKRYLRNPPVIVPPVKDRELKLCIFASYSTIANMLAQEDGNAVKMPYIIFVEFSMMHKFSTVQSRYCVYACISLVLS
ncbi:hypothetical protein CR513_28881, partial [Mucuna pruriens]